ncbi:hypothetical protein REPUB_Repub07fG0153100 [Reevesia pubescens]
MDYSCIVFDTAPTGHTLRLLQCPATLEKGHAKVMSLKSKFGGLLSQPNDYTTQPEISHQGFNQTDLSQYSASETIELLELD